MASLGETVFPQLLFAPSFDHRPMQPLRIWFRRWEAATVTFTPNWSSLGVDPNWDELFS